MWSVGKGWEEEEEERLCPEAPVLLPLWPDHMLAELEVDASERSEGNRFMILICSMAFMTHDEMTSSQLVSLRRRNECFCLTRVSKRGNKENKQK